MADFAKEVIGQP